MLSGMSSHSLTAVASFSFPYCIEVVVKLPYSPESNRFISHGVLIKHITILFSIYTPSNVQKTDSGNPRLFDIPVNTKIEGSNSAIPTFKPKYNFTLISCLELNLSLSVTTICGWNGLIFAEALSFFFFKHNWSMECWKSNLIPISLMRHVFIAIDVI